MRGRLWPGLFASLLLSSSIVLTPTSAAAFGTIDGAGQNREHERITRAALACPAGTGSAGDCPPGLNLPAPAAVLDLRGSRTPTVPPDLTTGCFVLSDRIPGVGACEGRITHAALNKDDGLVDPISGSSASPTTPRGMVGSNFAKAVSGAIVETRHQWQDLRAGMESRYGEEKALLMACALTHDDPSNDCRAGSTERTVAALAISGVLVGVLGVGVLLFDVRRRRRSGSARGSSVSDESGVSPTRQP